MAGAVRARRARHRTVRECVRHHSVRKWKYIMRFEIRYLRALILENRDLYGISVNKGGSLACESSVAYALTSQIFQT